MSEDEDLKKYRDSLMQFDHEASLNFDKAVMSLSGGALGLTITFIKDIVPNPVDETKIILLASWIALALSLTFILFSYLTSMVSLRKAMKQVDTKKISDFFFISRVYKNHLCRDREPTFLPGGQFSLSAPQKSSLRSHRYTAIVQHGNPVFHGYPA
jgi:hypothetical protein